MSKNRTNLRWGLIGASDIAETRMIPAINVQPDSVVHSIVSGSAGYAEAYAKKNSIPHAYHRLGAFLADPDLDVVYISSRNEKHREQALASFEAGKPVLCEKPLALNLADARAMVDVAAGNRLVFGTNHHLRAAVTHRTLRRLIQEGAIGQPLGVQVCNATYLAPRLQGWRLDCASAGGGVIMDLTVHDVDIIHFVLGLCGEEVMAQCASQGLGQNGLEDSVMGVIKFEGNILGQFYDSFVTRYASTGVEIHGTEGSLVATDVMKQDPIGRIVLCHNAERREISAGRPEDLYAVTVRRFNEAVRGTGEPVATGEDGAKSLAVALAVSESIKTGRRTKIRYDA
ncbi:MAG TPA: Gfo/Idh/MocA family oxidoreductase [Chthoniobacterales bacterium]|nr:Gfo/Idh/MocA family oxidoreductase [Chthoniobacterales bacterium]